MWKPLQLDDMESGQRIFRVSVGKGERLFISGPFIFLEINSASPKGTPGIWVSARREQTKDRPAELVSFSAGDMGLLAHTEYPMNFPDAGGRTFAFTSESYAFFADIVARQDLKGYFEVVGKPVRATDAQLVKKTLLNAMLGVSEVLTKQYRC